MMTDTQDPKKQELRDAIAIHMAAFFKSGGKIQQIPSGFQAEVTTSKFTITTEKKKAAKQGWKEGDL